jgi:hypothetical protein
MDAAQGDLRHGYTACSRSLPEVVMKPDPDIVSPEFPELAQTPPERFPRRDEETAEADDEDSFDEDDVDEDDDEEELTDDEIG